ncbi:MAG: glycosyltransferase [Acidobacteria bacterium]|nr:glycosyltransferase [Acidobacteriota bacterium]
MLLVAQGIILFFLVFIIVNFFLNLRVIKIISPKYKLEKDFPLISVLIPARNEESNITECLKCFQNQTYPSLEILVLDDESQDKTSLKVSELAKEDKRIKLIKGKNLPQGWVGKSWACHQLSEVAQGDWLLFTDADTRFSPDAISASLFYAIKKKADLLSIFPKQLANTIGVQVIIPLLYFMLYTVFPGIFLTRSKDIFAAIGQFLLFNKKAYQEINGHKAVSKSIIEDIDLAKTIKKAGKNLVLGDGNLLVSCQMYNSLRELWKGCTKNLFACFSYSLINLFIFTLLYLALYIWPFIALVIYQKIEAQTEFLILILVQILLIYMIRILLARRHCATSFSLLLHPVAILIFLANSFYSTYRVITGRGVEWKDRTYQQ